MAKRTLLDRLEVQPAAVHRIRGELDPARRRPSTTLRSTGVRLRLNLLGIGPDGHTASLFPNAPGLHERERLAIVAELRLDPFVDARDDDAADARRTPTIVVFLVTGEDKAEAVARAFGGPAGDETPSSRFARATAETIARPRPRRRQARQPRYRTRL